MMNNIYDLSSYKFSAGETILFDANVWLYLFPAPSATKNPVAYQYSYALKNLITSKAQLALDALILSEYLNRYCRIEYSARNTGLQFKDFRNSPHFASVGKAASAQASGIAKLCRLYDHPFGSVNLPELLGNFETGRHDVNDGLLTHVCSKNKWKFVTHDADFTTGGIDVLTANRKLLSAGKLAS